MIDPERTTFVPAKIAAARIGVPAKWLIAEARQGKIPSLAVGRRLLLNVDTITRFLLERAQIAAQAEEEMAHA